MSTTAKIALVTESQSLAATQNLLAALVSELCFARNIFNEDGESTVPAKRQALPKDF
jgi:hypothetical protein